MVEVKPNGELSERNGDKKEKHVKEGADLDGAESEVDDGDLTDAPEKRPLSPQRRPSREQIEPPPIIVEKEPAELRKGTYWAITREFTILGWTAFGGPTAHIGRFHKAFVQNYQWMSEETFSELLALCQAMPGPASTQMSFAIGTFQKGALGGLLSGALFQYPGLLIMSLAGFGAAKFLVDPPGWLHGFTTGLSAVAVALVAEAALLLGKKICVDQITLTLAVVSAAITFYYQTQWIFPLLIVLGGLVTIITGQKKAIPPAKQNIDRLGVSMFGGALLLAFWLAVLVISIVIANVTTYNSAKFIHWLKAFYLTGSVTYGGGQVVLPILQNSVVQYECVPTPNNQTCTTVESPDTWVTQEQFLAGLALAQAIPGPLFNFSAYLGAVVGGFPGIVACWLGLFGPGILIIYGVLPFWGKFRQWPLYKRAMPGLNSSAIGLIYASVFTLGLTAYKASPFPTASVSIGMAGYWATNFVAIPAPLAILGGGVLGIIAWATGCH